MLSVQTGRAGTTKLGNVTCHESSSRHEIRQRRPRNGTGCFRLKRRDLILNLLRRHFQIPLQLLQALMA